MKATQHIILKKVMQIEVWSDVICPWCYVGKHKLEMALSQFPHRENVQVVWRSFELDPAAPRNPNGTLNEMLAEKYSVTLQEAEAMNARVTAAAEEVGLDYHLESARPGITGVPCFAIDESIVIAGAQPVEIFANTLRQSWQES